MVSEREHRKTEMSPWRHKHIQPRPILLGRSNYRKWDITPPSALSGDGDDEVLSGFVAIPDPKPTGAQLFAVPNMVITTDGGGSLASAVEFWGDGESEEDPNGKLSEAALAALSSYRDPFNIALYGLGESVASGEGDGTYYSDYANVGPIPAGSGFLLPESLFGADYGGFGCAGYGLFATPYTRSAGTLQAFLQLCDSSNAVLLEVAGPVLQYDNTEYVYPTATAGTTTTTPANPANCPISWAGEIAKVRVKFTISGAFNCRGSGSFRGSVLRVY